MPKGALEITGENLEDLLAYDDLFLDYFNCFLSLPVFPQALVYNRLTGAFDEVEGLRPELMGSLPAVSPTVLYGPTDAERERMLDWAREERLPLFLRTQLFRELKLVKLLLRPLEIERQSASRGSSRNIRGYSRATESYISSLSVSGDHSGNDIYDYDDIWGELNYSALYRYQRPGSRALSLPTRVFLDGQSYGLPSSIGSANSRSSEQSSLKALSAITSRRFGAASTVQFAEFPEKPPEADQDYSKAILPSSGKTNETARQKARISNKVEVIPTSKSVGKSVVSKSSCKSKPPPSSTEEAFLRGARVLSAPVNYEQYLKMPRLDIHDFEALFGEAEPELGGQSFVHFDDEGVSEEQTETDMRNMEGRLKMTVQQVKERMMGSHSGFEDFKDFLSGTSGEHLLNFWLDCENFKDTMEDFDDIENMEIRNAQFRDILDKYKLKLTQDARDQVVRAASNMGLSHTIFLRTQYDVLRRLRAYWVPRFLIHCEMTREINDEFDDQENIESAAPVMPTRVMPLIDPATIKPPGKAKIPFFPCISLVHSMPVLPEDARDYANSLLMNVAYENNSASQRRMFPRQRSTLSARSTLSRLSTSSGRRSTKERFVLALASDRLAGGPFQRYLARLDDPQLLASLLFWEDVTEYGATEDHSSDRLLRLCHAWNIYNKYLSDDSPHRIALPVQERCRLQHSLEKARDFMESSIFDQAKVVAVEKLEKAWIRYLKEDLKTFLDCRVRPGGESPPSTAEAIEITVTEYDVVIKRPRPWVRRLQPVRVPGSTASERARRLNKALTMAEDIDDERKAQKKAEALARRKEMERERKKAIRAAYARQREAKKKKPSTGSAKDRLDEDLHDGEDGKEGGERGDKVPTFQDMSANRQMMSMFRKFVSDGENKDVHNMMQLYNDVETYFTIKEGKTKKDAQATLIGKNYLDPQGKKHANLNNEKLMSRIAQERDRPKTPLLKEIQRSVLPKVEEVFKEFITKQTEEFGMDARDLATMSQAELAMRMGNDQAMMSGWNKRKSRGKVKKGVADEEEEEEKKSGRKIGQLNFSSVKVNVIEGLQQGRFARPKPFRPGGRPRGFDMLTLEEFDAMTAPDRMRRRQEGMNIGGIGDGGAEEDDFFSGNLFKGKKGKGKKRVILRTISELDETRMSAAGSLRSRKSASQQLQQPQALETENEEAGGDTLAPLMTSNLNSSRSSNRPSSQLSQTGSVRGSRRISRKKTTGRAQATREDKNEFLAALGQSASGQPTMQMLYFYKYLLKHGEEDGMPQIDKDLFFYIEVQKFKDGSHSFSDEEMLKRKVQSIVECFLESVYAPSLQIDIPADLHSRAVKASQRYLSGKEAVPSLFDEAQYHVFKELLFYWAGFKRASSTPDDPKKRPVTKYDKLMRRRMENILNYQVPSSDFNLPAIPEGAVPSFSVSLSEGVKFKIYTPPPSLSSRSPSVAGSFDSSSRVESKK